MDPPRWTADSPPRLRDVDDALGTEPVLVVRYSVATEAGASRSSLYVTLGRMDSRTSGNTPVDEIYLGAIRRAHARSGEGPQASLLATLPLTDRFELFGRVGLFYWKNLQTARSDEQSVRGADRRWDPMISVGTTFHVRPRWSLRAAVELYRLEHEKVTTLQFGIVRRFGSE